MCPRHEATTRVRFPVHVVFLPSRHTISNQAIIDGCMAADLECLEDSHITRMARTEVRRRVEPTGAFCHIVPAPRYTLSNRLYTPGITKQHPFPSTNGMTTAKALANTTLY